MIAVLLLAAQIFLMPAADVPPAPCAQGPVCDWHIWVWAREEITPTDSARAINWKSGTAHPGNPWQNPSPCWAICQTSYLVEWTPTDARYVVPPGGCWCSVAIRRPASNRVVYLLDGRYL